MLMRINCSSFHAWLCIDWYKPFERDRHSSTQEKQEGEQRQRQQKRKRETRLDRGMKIKVYQMKCLSYTQHAYPEGDLLLHLIASSYHLLCAPVAFKSMAINNNLNHAGGGGRGERKEPSMAIWIVMNIDGHSQTQSRRRSEQASIKEWQGARY